jgi:hypothetical protein
MVTHNSSQKASAFESISPGAKGQWYCATDLLIEQRLEDLGIQAITGAIVLAVRRGFWNGNLHREETEIFLWGTEEQLNAAQTEFRLQTSTDALLDRPEIYWG